MRRRTALCIAAALAATTVATARADDAPGTFTGHGVTFAYPSTWLHMPATFEAQLGTALWTEGFAPATATPTADPGQPQPMARDLVAVASYHTAVSITKKTLARYRGLIKLAVAQLASQASGQVLAGPKRISVGRFAGYRFDVSVTLTDSTLVQSRLVFAFNKHTEYFLNCQHVQNGPLADEIESGCDQIMQSFRLAH